MRKLRPRPTIPLPDTYFVTSEQLRLAHGRSSYVWRKYKLPGLLMFFPPAMGTSPRTYRWRLDDVGERCPKLVQHLTPGEWFDRYKQRRNTEREAYLAQRRRGRLAPPYLPRLHPRQLATWQ